MHRWGIHLLVFGLVHEGIERGCALELSVVCVLFLVANNLFCVVS